MEAKVRDRHLPLRVALRQPTCSPMFPSQELFLPLKRSLKMWFMTMRRMASLVSLPSVMQKFRSGRSRFLRGGEFG